LWKLRTGAPWRDLPERYGPWQTCADRLYRWRRDGTWVRILARVQTRSDVVGEVSVASSIARAHKGALIGIYQVTADLNLLDNVLGLILPYIAINLVVSTFIMTGVFRALPKELLEAARADGCSVLRTFWQITLPLCVNGLIVVGMLNFIAMWGEFLLAYTLTSTPAARTLTVGMAEATAGTGVWEWPRIAAVYSVMIIPPIILFITLQKWFMKGITEGALRQ
jgi:ABC-type glycerol-3-phosphate transport system permease component